MHATPTPPARPAVAPLRRLLLPLMISGWAALILSCVTTTRMVMAPPSIPGATYVGSDKCATCHPDINEMFEGATHANLMAEGVDSPDIGCESCHGPGSLHVEGGGALHAIINPDKNPETCYQCHLDKKGEFNLPYTHPVKNGHMSCTDCHNPHEGSAIAGGKTELESETALCLDCHQAQMGPFAFEHEAIREGCNTCHSPHGSVNEKMLLTRNANLCYSCHAQQAMPGGNILIGGRNHNGFLNRGTCWASGCHEQVHGSHISSSLRF